MKYLRTIRRKLYTDGTLYRKTLKWVNEQRARRDLPPLDVIPSGKRNNIFYCPVATAVRRKEDRMFDVEARYHQLEWKEPSGWWTVKTPDYVREFMRRFDDAEMMTPHADAYT